MIAIHHHVTHALLALVLVALIAIAGVLATGVRGGPLDPTAPPAPTLKTLNEVEPRTPISGLGINITTPGSYYLTRNITASAAGVGIRINSDNVTLDLNGFTLTGGATSTHAIAVQTAIRRNIVIRNGTIRDWPGRGIDAGFAVAGEISHINFYNNGGGGIDGTSGGGGSSLLVTDNVLYNNGLVANADGIQIASGIVRNNQVIGSGRDGIRITVNSGTLIEHNVLSFNGTTVAGAGVHLVAGALNVRIEGNNASNNDTGIEVVAAAGNIIVANSARGNGVEYAIAPGNVAGPIQTGATLTNPWANIDY